MTMSRSTQISLDRATTQAGGTLIRIVLGHQGRLFRTALATVLSQEEDLEVIAEISNKDDALAIVQRERPRVIVLDHALPGDVPVLDLCVMLRASVPDCAILILIDSRASTGRSALARLVPTVGLMAIDASPSQLVDAVRQLARGEPVLDVHFALAALTAASGPLTEREREVLRLAADGAPAKEIAAKLFLSAGTVRNYLSRVIAKTGARTRIEAIRLARESGWI